MNSNKLIYNYSTWLNTTDPGFLKKQIDIGLEKAGYKVLNKIDHHFQPAGYTALWLLAESHLAVHTFPEENKTYIELAGCNKEMNNKFINFLQTLKTDEHKK